MLNSIKSQFITKKIFSNIDYSRKLLLIVYNKNFQHILNLNIIDYINQSRKYIKLERNGKGKEYDRETNNLLFEGEYLNGKRNGIGKVYEESNLIFEGVFLNGKRNGIGKEYSHNEIIFEGEYLNGKRNGKGKEYFYTDKLKFEGEYLNGERNGKGIEYIHDIGAFFQNDYDYDYIIGIENMFENKEKDFINNRIFEGEYRNGLKWKGKGKEYKKMVKIN